MSENFSFSWLAERPHPRPATNSKFARHYYSKNEVELSQNGNVIRVMLIEDQRDVREGLAVLINGSPGFRCVGAFRTMEEALRVMDSDFPDVVLTAIGLSGMS